jgi:gamma-D-glutamyl-L-lysine dipeptidyl-peptidase
MDAICELSLVAIRKEPASRSEMVSQLLFGELFEVLDTQPGWTLIRTHPDHCEGWVASNQVTVADKSFVSSYYNRLRIVTDNVAVAVNDSSKLPVTLLKGCLLPNSDEESFSVNGNKYSYSGDTLRLPLKPDERKISQVALSYINSPYLWGGRSPVGIDCSGFVQMVFKFCGIDLPREANEQAKVGELITFAGEAKQGDLAFFDNEQGTIIHAGIMVGDEQIIHSSGKVKVDKIDHHGIFDEDNGTYSHQLRIIKRIFRE